MLLNEYCKLYLSLVVTTYPAGNYMFKVETLEEGVKYVQS